LRILHVIATADPREGGPIEGVRRLGDAYQQSDHSQELLTLDPPGAAWLADQPFVVHPMGVRPMHGLNPVMRAWSYLAGAPRAARWLHRHAADYDGIVVNGLWNAATRVARKALPGGPTPYVVFPHGMLDPWFAQRYPVKHRIKQLAWKWNEGPLLDGAAAVLFTCEQERQLARRDFRPWAMREAVVSYGTSEPPGFEPAMAKAFRAAVPALGERRYLLFLSRIHEKKAIDVLLEAFSRVAPEHPGVDLVIAGPGEAGYVARLQALAGQLGIAERCHWPGMVTGPAKWGAYYGCEAMTLISHQENFGIVVAEALACGRRVVISDQVNIFDEIAAAEAGFVCRDELETATGALSAALDQPPAEREAMEARARSLFADRFEMSRTAQRLIAIFEDARKGLGPPRQIA
jgi:glycosyltransferase involved in cell wall biosynthesis